MCESLRFTKVYGVCTSDFALGRGRGGVHEVTRASYEYILIIVLPLFSMLIALVDLND